MALMAGVIGARLGYVAAHWSYFDLHRGKVLKIWLGGLSWHGALFGSLIGLALYCRLRRISLVRILDELALVAPLVGFFAWLGCRQAGCAYGREVFGPNLLAAELPDVFGIYTLRYDVQLLAAGWSLLTTIVLFSRKIARPRGTTFGLYLVLYGIGMAFVDTLRGDAVPHIGEWRLDAVLDLALAATGLLMAAVLYLSSRQKAE